MDGFLDKFTGWFADQLEAIVSFFKSMLIDVINLLIEAVASAIDAAAQLLPEITIPSVTELASLSAAGGSQALPAINWFIPWDFIIAGAAIWATSEVAYVVVAPVLRWFKLIRA